ncbi:uncharacterized protein LOC117295604 [Asterias rubens]|uniref:uncharacterized protein LOC117295604 n=1 Tax=Asterias rubens TaxID=7604 RepID=UPI001455D869|nr:uncharacterized protein LOC117295604 [Asterias rubens]
MASIKPNLDPAQFGNIKNISTTHCLIDVLHTLHANAELPKSISSILLTDFSKAFDHIDHTIAVSKLLKLGVPPHLAAWIGDFISNREQSVRYLDCFSEWTHTNAGVPQGTKLGAIIFLAIINDAGFKENNTSIKHFKYVDDMTVIETRDASVGSNLPSAITDLDVWSSDNKMQLNISDRCLIPRKLDFKSESAASATQNSAVDLLPRSNDGCLFTRGRCFIQQYIRTAGSQTWNQV